MTNRDIIETYETPLLQNKISLTEIRSELEAKQIEEERIRAMISYFGRIADKKYARDAGNKNLESSIPIGFALIFFGAIMFFFLFRSGWLSLLPVLLVIAGGGAIVKGFVARKERLERNKKNNSGALDA